MMKNKALIYHCMMFVQSLSATKDHLFHLPESAEKDP